jgi:hypothetical protein
MLRRSLLALALAACASTPTSVPTSMPSKEAPEPRTDGLRTSAEISQALEKAQAAYLSGSWGEVVLQANRVMEGAATPDEYYMAVKLLGLASCNRKDGRPVAFAYKRMKPSDQEALRAACEQNGLGISADGLVESK